MGYTNYKLEGYSPSEQVPFAEYFEDTNLDTFVKKIGEILSGKQEAFTLIIRKVKDV